MIKNKIYYLLIIIFFITNSSLYAKIDFGIINGKIKNFYKNPSKQSTVIRKFKNRELLQIIKKKGNKWIQVKSFNEKRGWVKRDDVVLINEIKSLGIYYNTILNEIYLKIRSDLVYNIQFDYLKENDIVIFKYSQEVGKVLYGNKILYDIAKNLNIVHLCNPYHKIIFTDKYLFKVGEIEIWVYDRYRFINKYFYSVSSREHSMYKKTDSKRMFKSIFPKTYGSYLKFNEKTKLLIMYYKNKNKKIYKIVKYKFKNGKFVKIK